MPGQLPLPRRPLRVSMIQNAAGGDLAENLRRLCDLTAAAPPADLLLLPECFALRGAPADYRAAAEIIPGALCAWAAKLARRRRAWVLAGSLVEKAGAQHYNTSLLFDRRGRLAARYRKIHLFNAVLPGGRAVRERAVYAPGAHPVLAEIDGWRCGLAVCYDLRFPELFRAYAAAGAHLLLLPANFTRATGRPHWEVLVRARAIENQAFVLAPNQCGANPADGVAAHGHSLAVDPWGTVLADGGARAGVVSATLHPAALARARARLPAPAHRRRFGRVSRASSGHGRAGRRGCPSATP